MFDRGQSLYDVWARYATPYAVVDRITRSIRASAVDTLGPDTDDTVLDLGCGPGSNLSFLAERLGPAGRVVGLDYSHDHDFEERLAAHFESVVVVDTFDAGL
ncbi:hypothetical protein BRD17_06390 [Halobacteriales archaeon SW_7_68_16]|nr:MAG: hypothetical protein BRD17_06390 [Halobacteriales archaeon SW_7_68_16]